MDLSYHLRVYGSRVGFILRNRCIPAEESDAMLLAAVFVSLVSYLFCIAWADPMHRESIHAHTHPSSYSPQRSFCPN